MSSTPLLEQVVHVLEKFHVPTLVGSDGNGLHILLDGTVYNFLNGSIVSQVDHLTACGLNDAPHDVNCGIVPIEERGRRDNADVVLGLVLVSW
jgi:hypothetical protein